MTRLSFLILFLSLSGMIAIAQGSMPEKPLGLLRVHIRYSHGQAIMVTRDRATSMVDTLIEYAEPFDFRNLSLWGRKDYPNPYYDKPYYNVRIRNKNARFIVISTMRDTMVIDFTNDSTLADHNLSFEFRKGHYYFDLPTLRGHYFLEEKNDLVSRMDLNAGIDTYEGHRFLTLNDLSRAQAAIFNGIPVYRDLPPFTLNPRHCLMLIKPVLGEIGSNSQSVPIQVTVEDEWCYLNYMIEPIAITPIGDPLNKPCNGSERVRDIQWINGQVSFPCDTSFQRLERNINQILINNRPVNCNPGHITYSHVEIPFLSDSVVSMTIITERVELLEKDRKEMERYREELRIRGEQNEEVRQRIKAGKGALKGKLKKVRYPELSFYDPEEVVTLKLEENWQRMENCIYEITGGVIPAEDTILRAQYLSMVVDPYSMRPYDITQLFGDRIREVVYQEMKDVHRSQPGRHFNLQHYLPENKRHFMWGLTRDSLVIFYGAEGEFHQFFRHEIPFSQILPDPY